MKDSMKLILSAVENMKTEANDANNAYNTKLMITSTAQEFMQIGISKDVRALIEEAKSLRPSNVQWLKEKACATVSALMPSIAAPALMIGAVYATTRSFVQDTFSTTGNCVRQYDDSSCNIPLVATVASAVAAVSIAASVSTNRLLTGYREKSSEAHAEINKLTAQATQTLCTIYNGIAEHLRDQLDIVDSGNLEASELAAKVADVEEKVELVEKELKRSGVVDHKKVMNELRDTLEMCQKRLGIADKAAESDNEEVESDDEYEITIEKQ